MPRTAALEILSTSTRMPKYHLRFDLGRLLSHLCNATDHSILTALLNNTLKLAKHEDIGRIRGVGALILTLKLLVSVQLHASVALVLRRKLPIGLHVRQQVWIGSRQDLQAMKNFYASWVVKPLVWSLY